MGVSGGGGVLAKPPFAAMRDNASASQHSAPLGNDNGGILWWPCSSHPA